MTSFLRLRDGANVSIVGDEVISSYVCSGIHSKLNCYILISHIESPRLKLKLYSDM